MTIIATYLDDKGCYFGSDTQMFDMDEGPLDCGPKWIVWKKSAFGLAGYFPAMNLLQNHMVEPLDKLDLGVQIREILVDHGYEPEHKSGYESWGCDGYYVTTTEGWEVDELYSLLPLEKDKLHMIGSGSDAAKGRDILINWYDNYMVWTIAANRARSTRSPSLRASLTPSPVHSREYPDPSG